MNRDSLGTHAQGRPMSKMVEKAFRHWEARRQVAAAQPDLSLQTSHAFTVALERETGTQGTAVAREVGRLLGWPVYDNELLEQIAQNMGLRTDLLKSVDERQQSWLMELAEAFLAPPKEGDWGLLVTETGYLHHLVKTVLALGIHGECVIVGRGASFILPTSRTLRVRLVGPVRERITALSNLLSIPKPEAANKIRTIDRERADFVQDHFFKDANDPRNYDLVLNAMRLSISECAELIVESLNRLKTHRQKKSAVLASR
jgi:cytidylate kinase